MTANCSMHVQKPLERHGRRATSVVRLVEGTTSVAESAERRRRRVSTSDVRRKLAACKGFEGSKEAIEHAVSTIVNTEIDLCRTGYMLLDRNLKS